MTTSAISPLRLVSALAGIALFSGVLLSLTYETTRPVIQTKQTLALQAAIFEVLAGAETFVPYRLDQAGLHALPASEAAKATVYAGLDGDGRRIGFALFGEARGYADVIRLLYGYDPEGQMIIGLKILSSNETPGLGDRIMKDPVFQENFTALDVAVADGSLVHPVETVKSGEKSQACQINGISGATVSSQAVGQALRSSTEKWLPMLQEVLAAEGEGI